MAYDKDIMKQYRCKVNTPWGEKGVIVNNMTFSFAQEGQYGFVSPENYPDLFEEVEVKSDEELLRYFCYQNVSGTWKSDFHDLVKSLLSQNAIKEDFIEKLRKGS